MDEEDIQKSALEVTIRKFTDPSTTDLQGSGIVFRIKIDLVSTSAIMNCLDLHPQVTNR